MRAFAVRLESTPVVVVVSRARADAPAPNAAPRRRHTDRLEPPVRRAAERPLAPRDATPIRISNLSHDAVPPRGRRASLSRLRGAVALRVAPLRAFAVRLESTPCVVVESRAFCRRAVAERGAAKATHGPSPAVRRSATRPLPKRDAMRRRLGAIARDAIARRTVRARRDARARTIDARRRATARATRFERAIRFEFGLD